MSATVCVICKALEQIEESPSRHTQLGTLVGLFIAGVVAKTPTNAKRFLCAEHLTLAHIAIGALLEEADVR